MSDQREPARDDLYAVKDLAARPCVCESRVNLIRRELSADEFKRLACRSCRAKRNLEELMELADEG